MIAGNFQRPHIVAIKILPAHAASPERRQRFEREARAISALSHPHICVLHDVGGHDWGQRWHRQWYSSAMKTTIDAAGRVVIPKSLRERLGLTGGRTVEVREREGCIEIEPAPTPMRLVKSGSGLVAVPTEPLPPLTDEIVRATIEQTRR